MSNIYVRLLLVQNRLIIVFCLDREQNTVQVAFQIELTPKQQ